MSVGGFVLAKAIGAGAYSKVWLATAPSGEFIAIKSTTAAKDADRKQQESLQRAQEEASFMKLLSHPNLVPVVASLTENDANGTTFHLVLPFYAGGDMLDYLRKKRSLPEPEARHFFAQICHGVNHMHASGVIHRDLKLENFFLSPDHRHIYVGDFGFAGTWARDKMQNKSWGSIHYASPEICSSAPYVGPEVDLWSLGVVLYALLCGKLPFNGDNDYAIYQQIVAAQVQLPPSVSNDAVSLVKGLLNPNRTQRIDMPALLIHPWMQLPAVAPLGHTSPSLERHRSTETLVTPLNMERLQQRRNSNAVAIRETTRRGSTAGMDDEQRSPSSSASSSPKSTGSRIESPGGTPRGEVSRRPSRFINLTGGRRFSISSLASKLVSAVAPGRSASPSSGRSPSPSLHPTGLPPAASPASASPPSTVFPVDNTP